MTMQAYRWLAWGACLLLPALGGCASDRAAVSHGQNTGLAGEDLVRMTDEMARKIMAAPAVQRAIEQEGTLRVVVEPVENQMTAEVLPRGVADAFTARLRALLSQHAPDKFIWIMNRDAFYHIRAKELEGVDLGPAPESIQPKYALWARFRTLTQEDSGHRSSYYLCLYQLTDLEQRTVLWTGNFELKKVAVKGMLD